MLGDYSPEQHAEYSLGIRDRLDTMDSPEAILGESIDVDFSPRDRVVDVGAVWDRMEAKGWPAKVPTVGEVPGYGPLLYAGLNSVAGASGAAKSWFSQILVAQEVKEGPVVVLDAETGDMPESYLGRLHALGMTREESRNLILYAWTSGVMPEGLLEPHQGRSARLLVADSMPEAMAALALDENSARHVSMWQQNFRQRATLELGSDAALLTIDGLPKGWSPGQDVRGGVGSGRKLYGVEAFFRVYAVRNGGRAQDGYSDIVCTKDRNGNHTEGAAVAELFYGPAGIGLRPPNDRKAAKRDSERAEARDKVLELLALHTEPRPDNPTREDIRKLGRGVLDELEVLADEGIVGKHKLSTGTRGGQPYGYFLSAGQ